MKAPRLKALEKNVLKYRAIQMVLLLHEYESLKRYIIGSIRCTDRLGRPEDQRIPIGCKQPMEKALDVLVEAGIISTFEKSHIKEYGAFRNRIGHEVHRLVADVSDIYSKHTHECLHDYWALSRLERLREKIERGMAPHFIQELSLAGPMFEQAELSYKEELERLDKKIQRQIAARLSQPVPNNSFKPKPLRGSA